MLFALAGAASSALDLLSSLVPAKSGSKTTGRAQNASFAASTAAAPSAAQPSGTGVVAQSGALSPQTLSALFAAQDPSQSSTSSSTSRTDALKDLFSHLDTDGNGKVSKSEFESQLGAGGTNVASADSVFGKLDTDGDGSVSLDELSAALKGKSGHAHHAHGAGGGKGGGQDALLQALDGSSSTTISNSDGSTTTTMTYADGSTMTLTTPAAASAAGASGSASSSYNLVEKMIQKQTDALARSAQQSLSVNV